MKVETINEAYQKLLHDVRVKNEALKAIESYLPDYDQSLDCNMNKVKDIAWKGYIGEEL